MTPLSFSFLFFFNDTATPEIYTLSLHDALPIWIVSRGLGCDAVGSAPQRDRVHRPLGVRQDDGRSEEHTSELQSPVHLVCRLLLEKKKTICTTISLLFSFSHSSPLLLHS